MYEVLVLLIIILFVFSMLKYRETFVVKIGNPFNDEDIISFDNSAKGTRLFGCCLNSDTCPADKPEYDAGLCYQACEEGYSGVGPVCWANTTGVGIGKVMKLLSCADSGYPGWTDTGLFCNQPIKCGSGWKFFTEGCSGGRVRPKRMTCDTYPEHKDEVAALCYRRCPADKPNRVPGLPMLCMKGKRGLSYGRGAGGVPQIFAFG